MTIKTLASILALSTAGLGVLQAQAPTELINSLTKTLGVTPEQATGAAGAIFSSAKSKLPPDQWSKVAGAVPGMDGLLKAAPAAGDTARGPSPGGAVPGAGALGDSFSKLGLSPDMASKAVPIVGDYVSKVGGPEVGKIFAGAFK